MPQDNQSPQQVHRFYANSITPALGVSTHVLPCLLTSTCQDSVADLLCFLSFSEGWTAGSPILNALQEVCHLVHECVLIADLQTWHPPLIHVRHVAVSDVH